MGTIKMTERETLRRRLVALSSHANKFANALDSYTCDTSNNEAGYPCGKNWEALGKVSEAFQHILKARALLSDAVKMAERTK